jgi:HlyD family secretion protein
MIVTPMYSKNLMLKTTNKKNSILALFLMSMTAWLAEPVAGQDRADRSVSALGRLEPLGGIVHVSAPSTPQAISGSLLSELHVGEGDDVTKGQLLAVTDTAPVLQAFVEEARAELDFSRREVEAARSRAEEACVRADVAQREADRRTRLHEQGVAGEEEAESARGEAEARAASCTAAKTAVRSAESAVAVAAAHVVRTEAEFGRSQILAPISGRVLSIIAHPGELVGMDGLLELGRVDQMVAVAEVYETDIRYVRKGMRATISSAALAGDLGGTVEFIHQKVEKQDEIGTDPAARKDARIVEVEVLLDDSASAAHLTNLQVDVIIHREP